MKLTLVVLLSVLLTSLLTAQGWGKTNWGMSPAAVVKAVGGPIVDGISGVPGYSTRAKDDSMISGYPFETFLRFSGGGLTRVLLRYEDTIPGKMLSDCFKDITRLLTAKYGESQELTTPSNLASQRVTTARWTAKETRIGLTYVEDRYVAIEYWPLKDDTDTSNL